MKIISPKNFSGQQVLLAVSFLLGFCISLNSQTFLGHRIHFTPKDIPAREFDAEKYKAQLKLKYDSACKDKEQLEEFAAEFTDSKKYFLSSNYEYEKLDTLNAYLQQIADLINKPGATPVKVRICRNPSVNASAFEDGTIYVNIGLLALFETEAQIAALLGHEITHVTKKHALPRYLETKEFLNHQARPARAGLGTLVIQSVRIRNFSKKLMATEEESDAGSALLLAATNYNIKALQQTFELLDKTEKKYAARYGEEGRSFFYIQSHPSGKDRIEKAAALSSAGAGKNFIVDSLLFVQLKKLALDETINLYFENMQLDECLEAAFMAHLAAPNDPFYLFYVTECTRRIIATDAKRKEEVFINGAYVNPYACFPKKEAVYPGGLVFTDKKYSAQKKKHLSSVFYLQAMEVKAQTTGIDTSAAYFRNDTLEFHTNADALAYFTSINAKQGYTLNNVFTVPDDMAAFAVDMGNCDLASTQRESFYRNLPAAVNVYEKQKAEKHRILLVVYDINYSSVSHTMMKSKVKLHNNKYDDIVAYTKKFDSTFHFPSELHFNERNNVSASLDIVYPVFHKKTDKIRAKEILEFNMKETMPELSALLLNHNYSGVIFSGIDIQESATKMVMGMGTANSSSWKYRNFYLDVKTGKINFVTDFHTEMDAGVWGTTSGNPTDNYMISDYLGSLWKTVNLQK